jgi:thiamine biosynthesis lipoprotein
MKISFPGGTMRGMRTERMMTDGYAGKRLVESECVGGGRGGHHGWFRLDGSKPTRKPQSPTSAGDQHKGFLNLRFEAMTTQVGLWLSSCHPMAAMALEKARHFVHEAEQRLSRFVPDSELARLNAGAGSGPRRVSLLLWELVETALDLARVSTGLVDPTVLPGLVRAGYGPGNCAGAIDYRAVELNREAQTITLPRATALDLGGVAKGWLADQIATALGSLGPTLVDMGGDLRAHGNRPWAVGLEAPLQPGRILLDFDLSEGGVATSSIARRRWGTDRHHLIDPRSGMPARTDLWQASVFAPTATAAEGAAKTVVILGCEAGQAYLAQAGMRAILVRKDGQVVRT